MVRWRKWKARKVEYDWKGDERESVERGTQLNYTIVPRSCNEWENVSSPVSSALAWIKDVLPLHPHSPHSDSSHGTACYCYIPTVWNCSHWAKEWKQQELQEKQAQALYAGGWERLNSSGNSVKMDWINSKTSAACSQCAVNVIYWFCYNEVSWFLVTGCAYWQIISEMKSEKGQLMKTSVCAVAPFNSGFAVWHMIPEKKRNWTLAYCVFCHLIKTLVWVSVDRLSVCSWTLKYAAI